MPFKNCKRKELASLSYSYQDTGMHRPGFEEDSIGINCYFKRNDNVQIRSILFILPQDDLKHRDFTLSQINLFDRMSSESWGTRINPIRHILNTLG
jgi:alanine racemase